MIAFSSFKKRYEGRTAGASESGVYEYKRVYQGVAVDDARDEVELLAEAISLVPGVHPSDESALLRSVQGRQMAKRPDFWWFDCIWRSGGSDTNLTNPLLEAAKVSYRSSRKRTVTSTDRDGTPVLNAVGDPLLHEHFDAETELVVTKNVAEFIPELAQEYRNAVISTAALGFPAYALQLADVQADSDKRNGISFMRLSVSLAVAGPPFYRWHPVQVPHVGNRALTRDDTLARIVDSAGNPLEYAFLSQADVPIEGQNSSDPTKGKGGYAYYLDTGNKTRPVPPNFLPANMYPLVPFNALGIYP